MADGARVGGTFARTGAASDEPREARLITVLLQSLGVEECEPRVYHQLLEVMHRYTSQVFQDARMFSEHAGRADVDLDDLKLAIQSKFLEAIAAEKNKQPLPPIPEGKLSIRLPADRYCLTAPNYDLVPKAQSQAALKAESAADFVNETPISINATPVEIKPVPVSLKTEVDPNAMDVDDDYDAPGPATKKAKESS